VGRTFILPYGVKSIGFTTSKFGITAKELIGTIGPSSF
jgi:hypothetical protein